MLQNILKTFVVLAASTLVAYATWNDPVTPPLNSVLAPLNQGLFDQEKGGGLWLNALQSAQNGLLVTGLTNGLVKIGGVNGLPNAELDLEGDFGIRGLLMAGPYKNTGNPGEILTWAQTSPATIDWAPDAAWMNIARIDKAVGQACISILPNCPTGWSPVDITVINPACGAGAASGILESRGGAIRTCSRNF